MSTNIAQPLLHVSIKTHPSTKSSSSSVNTLAGNSCYGKNQGVKLQSSNFINGVRSMKADGNNVDQLRRPGLKRREPSAAPIGLWGRFPAARTVQQMLETMDNLIEDPYSFTTPSPSSLASPGRDYARGRTPWEIKDVEGAYKMRFDMPGMTKDDVNLWVEDNMLVIKAEKVHKSHENDDGGEEWSAKSYGKYSSRIALPENVEFEKIKAEVKDGVLYVTVPKASKSSKVFNISVQ